MKGLGDWLHAQGLKFGIYSSPGPTTCGGYLGSYKHELKDAETYAKWGVDYLKYDLCSYKWDIQDKLTDTTETVWTTPFKIWREALDKQNRDIIYSICSYNTIPWVEKVGGNLTRLSGDIRANWEAIVRNGFGMTKYAKYQKPGRWNDPDMLVIGNNLGGWEGKAYPTLLNPYEQYSHVSLWALYSAPLLIGCDLANMEDGSKAIGIFNLAEVARNITIKWSDLGLHGGAIRDLWSQIDQGVSNSTFSTNIPPHGVKLIKVEIQKSK